MSSSYELYTRLHTTLQPLVTVAHRKHLTNRLWIVVGLLLGQAPALSQIANYLPMSTAAEARDINPALAPKSACRCVGGL
jgi:hypothetical protein